MGIVESKGKGRQLFIENKFLSPIILLEVGMQCLATLHKKTLHVHISHIRWFCPCMEHLHYMYMQTLHVDVVKWSNTQQSHHIKWDTRK